MFSMLFYSSFSVRDKMASRNSQYYSFADQTSASNDGYLGKLASSFVQEGSWAADEAAGSSYTGFEQQLMAAAPPFQASIMSGQVTAAFTTEPQQQQQQQHSSYRPHHQQQPKKQPSQPQIFYCEICRVSCAGPQPYADHLNGQKHKKKGAAHTLQQKLDQFPKPAKASSSTANRLYCEMCDVACGSVDTFTAHIRGVKHQRVLNLHTMMGKPVPNVSIPQPQDSTSAPAPASAQASAPAFASSSVPTPGKKLDEVKSNISPAAGATDVPGKTGTEATLDTSEIVGKEFIEEVKNAKGSVVSYNCKLCECSFTDPNARHAHLKGRRHRLQYKKKIDTTLEIDTKPNLRMQKIREERTKKQKAKELYWRQQDFLLGMRMEMDQSFAESEAWNRSRYGMGPRQNTVDDRYMINKHMDLYPPKDQMSEIHDAIVIFETALKLVSDVIAAEDESAQKTDVAENSQAAQQNSEKTGEAQTETSKEEPSQDLEKETMETAATEAVDCEASRRIKGAMRVGLLSKGLLLRDDLVEHLIVICSDKPTRSLIQRIIDHLPEQLEVVCPEKKFNIEPRFDEAGLFVTIDEPSASFAVTLTSMMVSEDNGCNQEEAEPGLEDQLSPAHCLSALALLRHTKWFQVRMCTLKAGTVVSHVLRDFCRRNPVWTPLSDWAQELLVEKCIFAAGVDIGPGEAFRSFFECISSGILLPGGHGLMDPCEKVPTDVTANLVAQQREDITASAQKCLRLIVYRQMYKVLDVRQLKRTTVKRQRDRDDKAEVEQEDKKLKEDNAVEGIETTTEVPLITGEKNIAEEP